MRRCECFPRHQGSYAIPKESDGKDEEDPDKRITICSFDKLIACMEDFSTLAQISREGVLSRTLLISKSLRVKREDKDKKDPEKEKEVTKD